MATKEDYLKAIYADLSLCSSTEWDALFNSWWELLSTDSEATRFYKIKKRFAHKMMTSAAGKVDITIGTDKYQASQELKQWEAIYKASSDELDKHIEAISVTDDNSTSIRTIIR